MACVGVDAEERQGLLAGRNTAVNATYNAVDDDNVSSDVVFQQPAPTGTYQL